MKKLIQASLTFLRGVSEEEEQPVINLGSWTYPLFSVVALAISIFGAHWVLTVHQPWLYPMLLITDAIGQSAVYTAHQYGTHQAGGHENSSRIRLVNHALADINQIVLLSVGRQKYRLNHGKHHIPILLATYGDLDYQWLWRLGFIPGKTLDYYWKNLWLVMLSPKFHVVFIFKRLKMVFVDAPNYCKLLALLWWVSVFSLALYVHALPTLIVGYLVPVTIGYNLSTLLQLTSEHRWLYSGDPADKTFPRYLPIELPTTRNPLDWLYFLALSLVYLWYRTAILTTDLPNHHLHHKQPRNYDFTMVAYSEAAKRDRDRAVWGIRNHFKEAFKSLATASG